MFKFLRRARFNAAAAKDALYKSLTWRLEADIDGLASKALHSSYISATHDSVPLFWMHTRFRDRLGRPGLYVRLRHIERTPDGGLEELKECIIACLDVVRRYLQHVNRRRRAGAPPVLQCTVILDMDGSGMSNFEPELVPFALNMLKGHFPGHFDSVYLVRYGWVHSGMWRLAKPVLPPRLLSRVFFPSTEVLLEQFDGHVPPELGGTLSVELASDSSNVFNHLGRIAPWRDRTENAADSQKPASSARARPDYESIYDVMSRVVTVRTTRTHATDHSRTEAAVHARPSAAALCHR